MKETHQALCIKKFTLQDIRTYPPTPQELGFEAQVRLAQAAMGNKETVVSKLCKELGITKPTLYRYVDPKGNLREYGKKVLGIED